MQASKSKCVCTHPRWEKQLKGENIYKDSQILVYRGGETKQQLSPPQQEEEQLLILCPSQEAYRDACWSPQILLPIQTGSSFIG